MHGKFNCINVDFERTQHYIYVIQFSLKLVATVYIKGNWFVIPLAINVLGTGTEFPKYLSLVQESTSTRKTFYYDILVWLGILMFLRTGKELVLYVK